MLFAATGFARQEKELICHVGNEAGPGEEVYLDDPGCVPHVGNDYFCPDAGKIDLISVAKPAKHLNNPGAVRAVGLANGSNPISIIIPCHRVIGADGSMTGFGGGLDIKRQLLAHEGVLLSVL